MNPDVLTAYLLETHWKRKVSTDRYTVFAGPKDDLGQTVEIVVPRSLDYYDAKRKIEDSLELLAAIEETSVEELSELIETRHRREVPEEAVVRMPAVLIDWSWAKIAAGLAAVAALVIPLAWLGSQVAELVTHISWGNLIDFQTLSAISGLVITLAAFNVFLADILAESFTPALRQSVYVILILLDIVALVFVGLHLPFSARTVLFLQWQGIVSFIFFANLIFNRYLRHSESRQYYLGNAFAFVGIFWLVVIYWIVRHFWQ